MSMIGYTLARSNCKFARPLSFYVFFTLLFSGGMVPSYILMTQVLNWKNTYAVMIVPSLVYAFHVIMIRTFFQKLPPALFESAKIDGANEFVIFFPHRASAFCAGAHDSGVFYGHEQVERLADRPFVHNAGKYGAAAIYAVPHRAEHPVAAHRTGAGAAASPWMCGISGAKSADGHGGCGGRPDAGGVPLLPEILHFRAHRGRGKGINGLVGFVVPFRRGWN